MRAPSLNRLLKVFPHLERQAARLIRAFAHAADDEEELSALVLNSPVPATQKYVGSLYSNPFGSAIWRATVALHAIDELLGSHGVEAMGPVRERDYAPKYEYLNMGDPYKATLVYSRDSRNLYIACQGDVQARLPRGVM